MSAASASLRRAATTLAPYLDYRPDARQRIGEEDLVRRTKLGQAEVADLDAEVQRLRQVQYLMAHDTRNAAVTDLGVCSRPWRTRKMLAAVAPITRSSVASMIPSAIASVVPFGTGQHLLEAVQVLDPGQTGVAPRRVSQMRTTMPSPAADVARSASPSPRASRSARAAGGSRADRSRARHDELDDTGAKIFEHLLALLLEQRAFGHRDSEPRASPSSRAMCSAKRAYPAVAGGHGLEQAVAVLQAAVVGRDGTRRRRR